MNEIDKSKYTWIVVDWYHEHLIHVFETSNELRAVL